MKEFILTRQMFEEEIRSSDITFGPDRIRPDRDALIEELMERFDLGQARHEFRPWNLLDGRNLLQEAHEEDLDSIVYRIADAILRRHLGYGASAQGAPLTRSSAT